MESPAKRYKYLSNIDNIKGIAYDTIFTKYIIQNLRAEEKMLEIDSTDQEGLIRKLNGGYPLPGFIYTFIYPPLMDGSDNIKVGKKEYIDYVPLVFCITTERYSFKGINLNTLPPLERVNFLETYYRGYSKFFKNLEDLTENNELALNMEYIRAASSSKGQELIKLFDQIAGANFKYGYRQYKLNRIRQLRMLEYSEWNYIPHFQPTTLSKLENGKITKVNPNEVYDNYYIYNN